MACKGCPIFAIYYINKRSLKYIDIVNWCLNVSQLYIVTAVLGIDPLWAEINSEKNAISLDSDKKKSVKSDYRIS